LWQSSPAHRLEAILWVFIVLARNRVLRSPLDREVRIKFQDLCGFGFRGMNVPHALVCSGKPKMDGAPRLHGDLRRPSREHIIALEAREKGGSAARS